PPFTRAIYCPPGGCVRYLTVDWDEEITTACLHGADQLIEDMFCPNPDAKHNLVLERGTQAPDVEGVRHYLIEIRDLTAQDLPTLPDDMTAVVAYRMTPVGAEFNRDIFLTLGFDTLQLPDEARHVDIFFYDEGDGLWVSLGSQPAPPNGVAEISLSAPIRHFTVFAVLASSVPPSTVPATFFGSDLSIVPGVKKTWSALTFVTRTGEDVTITAKVTNEGGQAGTYTANLKLNGETVDSTSVTLGAGQSQYVTFTVSGLDRGEYEVEVAGLSDTFTAFRTITWWLIVVLLAAIGLIVWGVARARRKRRARQQA
ncbi:MAG: CARDB domain-containing protein, partial [Dehalococcoidia bacterium]